MTPGDGYLHAAQLILDRLDIDSITTKELGDLMGLSYQRACSLLKGLGWVRCGGYTDIWFERPDTTKTVCPSAKRAGRRIAQRVLEKEVLA